MNASHSLHLIIRMNVRMHSYELRIDFFFHMRILHLEACFWLDLKCVCIHTNSPLVKGDSGSSVALIVAV
jgi:hypothetical protein